MPKKYSFPKLGCSSCEHLQRIGGVLFDASVNYGGSEGIYIDCYLRGKLDESGRSVLHVGTLKTLRQDLEALQIMGELCGTLTFYVDQYVNQNLHRYTPKDQLEREYERMRSEARKAGGGDHE